MTLENEIKEIQNTIQACGNRLVKVLEKVREQKPARQRKSKAVRVSADEIKNLKRK